MRKSIEKHKKKQMRRYDSSMSNILEIRWHGRGGQGTKTASLLLADAAFNTGKYVQGFPEYGPERMGAPITAYNRISDQPITLHCNIYDPDYVVVVDDSLLEAVDVTAGIKQNGSIIINTQLDQKSIISKLRGFSGNVYRVDARKISEEYIGKYFPNVPMLGAVMKVSQIMPIDKFIDDMQESFNHKFSSKPQVIEGNMNALKKSVSEVTKI